MIPPFAGCIFDLDGTLLDSMHIWEQIDVDFLARRGIAATEDYTHKMAQLSYQEGAEYTIARYHLPETPAQLIQEWDDMSLEAYREHILLKEGAAEYLRLLKQQGCRLAVATALTPSFCEPVLRRNGIYPLFDAFAFVQEVPRGKGFPDIYLLAARRLSLPPERCLVFEDILPGILGAKAGGFATCGVEDSCSQKDRPAILREADYYIRSFRELL